MIFRGVFRTLPNIYDEAFGEKVNYYLTIFTKSPVLDVWHGSEDASDIRGFRISEKNSDQIILKNWRFFAVYTKLHATLFCVLTSSFC